MQMPKIKFSKIYTNGSCADRTRMAVDLNKQIYSDIYPLYQNSDFANIRNIERILKKNMPESIFFRLKKLTPDEGEKYAGGLITYFFNNKVVKYKISLPAKNNKLHISNIPTLMHESMHLFDVLLNPKYIKTAEKVKEKKLFDISQDIYEKCYYNNEGYLPLYKNKRLLKKTKKETNHSLKSLKAEDKILVLNYIRECLQGEIKAFCETQKYVKLLSSNKRKCKKIELDNYQKSYMFEEKLDIVNSILYKTIKKERNNNFIHNKLKFFIYYFA